ncbi:MAG: hypothetical protein ACJ0F6_02400, partial [Acidimicrobiales bacterium]
MKILRKLIKFAAIAAVIAFIVSRIRSRAAEGDQDEDESDFSWPPINLTDSEEPTDPTLTEPSDG